MFGMAINNVSNVWTKAPQKQKVYSLTTLPQLQTISFPPPSYAFTATTESITAVCMNDDQTIVYAVSGNGIFKYSSGSWVQRLALTKVWTDIACNSTGQYVVAVIKNTDTTDAKVYYSTDYGVNFTAVLASTTYTSITSVAMNNDGGYTYIATHMSNTVSSANNFYISTNYGQSWTTYTGTNIGPATVKINPTGQYVVLYANNPLSANISVAISSDYGLSFVRPGGANAGQYGTNVGINSLGKPAWYYVAYTGGSWTTMSRQYYDGTTVQFTNAANTPTTTAGLKYYACSNDTRMIVGIEAFANGKIWVCTNGIQSVTSNGQSGASDFTAIGTTATWTHIKANNTDSFVISNTNGYVYIYSWTLV
jgi:hypothetical protein